jgi:hypothetical protein
MIPAGYLAKRVSIKPDWLRAQHLTDIYSVSGCVSEEFADYVDFWKHNGFWLFDSPEAIQSVAQENSIDLAGTTLFYTRCTRGNLMATLGNRMRPIRRSRQRLLCQLTNTLKAST